MLHINKHFKLTRIAPTPSGYLHLGNAYSFALTAAIAKRVDANILLRIDDIDRDRVEIPYVNDIFDTLKFLDIPWQQGPGNTSQYENEWSQLCRMDIYQPVLDKLVQSDKVFACTCSRRLLQTPGYQCSCQSKKLPLDTADCAWRISTDQRTLTINTLEHGAMKYTLPSDMTNFVVRKKDGYPAYQLTSLIDDTHFGVDLIIRGADLWHSTIAQHYLASVLGVISFTESTFHHHELLTTADDTKLSKSAGATSIQYLRKQGLSAEQVYAQIGEAMSPTTQLSNWADLSHNF